MECAVTVGVPDMTAFSEIDENGINSNLKIRYEHDIIYTYTGSILVAVNPYKELKIFNNYHIHQYHAHKLGTLAPHVFALAEAAYRSIRDDDINQSCVISGESGAGKTESTKFILQYLCAVTADVSTWVQQQILEANTVLEAFGNAKTVRNDNSSRFGKFMQICFDTKHCIRGCIIQDYLLEQSRITFQSAGERNYHVLYQLVAQGQKNADMAKTFNIKPPDFYRYLNAAGSSGNPVTIDLDYESKKFEALTMAFTVLQIPQLLIDGVLKVLSAILWLGNLEFSDIDGERCELLETDREICGITANLLGLRTEDMILVVLSRQINVRGNITEIPLKLPEARENRHAMAKALYSRTFAWLVSKINSCTNPGQDGTRFLGVLDIFGFENFTKNSFEQLCINYTNEKLHKFFNHYVFAVEQEIYKQEEIAYSHVDFTDNSLCLELIEKPPRCIFKLLTEQCHMPKGSDAAYINNLHTEFEFNPYFVKGNDRRHWEREFGIRHYAGSVYYVVEGFVDKNRDVQQDVFFDFMSRSENSFVRELSTFQDQQAINTSSSTTMQRGTSKAKFTVSDNFRQQLQALIDVLQNTRPWYVRCIKPNSEKSSDTYNDLFVLDQLKYLGMLDIIRIRREGFPIHLTLSDFYYKYKCLLKHKAVSNTPEHVSKMMTDLMVPRTEWQIGKTKIFLRAKAYEPLEDNRKEIVTASALRIQKNWRCYAQKKTYREIHNAVLKIQHAYRGWKLRIKFLRMRRAAIIIQSHLRGAFAREVATALREMRRVDEEMKKREKINEVAKLEMETQANQALEDCERLVKEEMQALTHMAEQINCRMVNNIALENGDIAGHNDSSSHQLQTNDSVDLDNLFAFLSEVTTSMPVTATTTATTTNPLIDEIGDKMDDLVQDLEEELENCSQRDHAEPNSNTIGNTATLPKGKPSLPEPTMPPPPPPTTTKAQSESTNVGNPSSSEFAINDTKHSQQNHHRLEMKPEPIYEAVLTNNLIPKHANNNNNNNNNNNSNNNNNNNNNRKLASNHDLSNVIATAAGTTPIMEHRDRRPPTTVTNNSNADQHQLKRHNVAGSKLKTNTIDAEKTIPNAIGVYNKTQVIVTPKTDYSNAKHQPQQQQQQQLLEQHPPDRELRRKHRVEKKILEMHQSVTTDVQRADVFNNDVYYDLLEFAENNFNCHERSPEGTIMATLTRKNKRTNDIVPKYEMLTYFRGEKIPSSHIHMYDPENVALACNIFRELCKYMRGELNAERELVAIQYIIGSGIEREELRDEIYVQCIRQTTNNPHTEWTDRLWLLMCLTIVAFQPSKVLFRFFVSYLKKNLEAFDGKLRQYAQWCFDNCKCTKVSARLLPPSSVEVAAMRRLGTIVCRFFFLDGRTKAIDVHPTDTAGDAVVKLAEKLNLTNIEGWAIFQSRPDGEDHIKSYDYLYDIIAAWEMKQMKLPATSTVNRRLTNGAGSGENRFVFKKRLFKSTRELSQDPVEVNMLYAQAVYSVVKCDDFPVSEKVALQLAGLQAQVALGDPSNQPKPEYYSDINNFLPERISKTREKQFWIPILAQAHRQYGAARNELTAKVLYLSCVMQYPLYGTTMFGVIYKGYWNFPSSIILGVNYECIMFIQPEEKLVIYQFKYSEVESIMLDPSDSFITITLNRQLAQPSAAATKLKEPYAALETQKCFVFETLQKQEIGSLIVSYYPPLSNWIMNNSENSNPKKTKGITNEDRSRLYQNVVLCRRQLVDADLVRRPQETGGFFRNTLRRLSKHRLEKLRAEQRNTMQDHGETYKGFPHSFWAFFRQQIPQCLSKLNDQEETIMSQVFQAILTYSGLGTTGETIQRAEDEHITIVQSIMDKCMRKDSLINELYLQLVKQTTDHPDPNSRVNLRHWALLSLACSVILPPLKTVRKYLIAHLKRCASDYLTEEGKYARFAEKCFFRTQGTRRRQWPPSREEIMCTINRRPCYARFHFMDGQFYSVEFQPSSTAHEVMEIIKRKIGLQENARGYAIYEVLGSFERCLLMEEKVTDVMAKWEKYRNATQQSLQGQTNQSVSANCRYQHHIFLFKKHLFCDDFINLDDPVEKELLYHQILHCLRTERFPITEMEAIMLTALQGQLELSDCGEEICDYRVIASHCLPPRFVPNIPHEAVALHHQSLRGMSSAEAKKSFLNLIQSWPLYRATIFDVMQTFTSNWPRNLWLAVDQKGIHLLEHRSRNVLCTHDYESIKSYSPNMNSLMIFTGTERKQSKVILTTTQAFQIATLIKEYSEIVKGKEKISPNITP